LLVGRGDFGVGKKRVRLKKQPLILFKGTSNMALVYFYHLNSALCTWHLFFFADFLSISKKFILEL